MTFLTTALVETVSLSVAFVVRYYAVIVVVVILICILPALFIELVLLTLK